MIRLTHLLPVIALGGLESVLRDLCRHRDPDAFECTVGSVGENISTLSEEIRAAGARVVAGMKACRDAIDASDIVNIHWYGPHPAHLSLADNRPRVTTLHSHRQVPPLSCVTICTSEHVYRAQADPSRCVVIPNGIDLELFPEAPHPPRDEVVITRVCRQPRCATYFWEVVHRVLARYPQARFRIVGNPGPAEHPSGRVEFLGVRRDIPQILADSDIFLYLPYPEVGTKDLAVMEAASVGVPGVVSDVSVTRESVEQERTGFLTPFGDVEAAAARLGELIEDADLRRRMGRAAAALARERFDVRGVARRYEAVYRTVLEARPGYAS